MRFALSCGCGTNLEMVGAARSRAVFLWARGFSQDGCDSDCSIPSWDPAWLWKWSGLHIHLCSQVCRRPERVTQLGNRGQERGESPLWRSVWGTGELFESCIMSFYT